MPVRQTRCGDLLVIGPAWRGYMGSYWGRFLAAACGVCAVPFLRREALIGEGSAAGERTQDTNRAEGVALMDHGYGLEGGDFEDYG
ncbi:hypothetical protein IG631_07939 [Alternaria alternata]|nr:hypothetical protein IG631_07939 [Alternaria alternata]